MPERFGVTPPCTFGTQSNEILQSSVSPQSSSFRKPESVTPSVASAFPASITQKLFIFNYFSTIGFQNQYAFCQKFNRFFTSFLNKIFKQSTRYLSEIIYDTVVNSECIITRIISHIRRLTRVCYKSHFEQECGHIRFSQNIQ